MSEIFTGLAETYQKYRPNYPNELFDYLAENGMNSKMSVVDIGAGTGIFTKQLLERKINVIGIEPNDDMRLKAAELRQYYPNLKLINASAEHTGLLEHSVDMIVSAQAFHWFDIGLFQKECNRILKPGGKVCIVWNHRDASNIVVKKNAQICKKYCPKFLGFSGGGTAYLEKVALFFNGNYEEKEFFYPISFTEKTFIGRNLSASYSLQQKDTHFQDFCKELRELFWSYAKNGILELPNKTKSYLGTIKVMEG